MILNRKHTGGKLACQRREAQVAFGIFDGQAIPWDVLGVDGRFQVRDLKPRNVGSNKTKVGAEVYEYLNAYFLPDNEELYQLLGKALSW